MTNTLEFDKAAELKKFSDVAQVWWDESGPMKALHAINVPRAQFIMEISSFIQGKLILDVGCGGGLLTTTLASKGGIVTGIDENEALIEVATQEAERRQLTIDYQAIDDATWAETHENYYDIITCMELLEHVEDPIAIIQNSYKMLKPNGLFFVSTINRTVSAYLLAIVAAEYIFKLLPLHTHSYEQFIKPHELAQWCRDNNFTLLKQRGIRYSPFSNYAELSNDISVNYLACYQKPTTYRP